MKIGMQYRNDQQCECRIWAPYAEDVQLRIHTPVEKQIPMEKENRGYWSTIAKNIEAGSRYSFVLDGEKERPDPASHFQPEGVHKSSEVIDHNAFQWSDSNWQNIPLKDVVIYELHVGTFTSEGTFSAIIPRLDELKSLGVNAIELMPVAQFPGNRNWGYDGVYPFAVQNSYGGPDQLKQLVNACHEEGMAVYLDVVYNHMGPEGNYLWDYGQYFTQKYHTPWGEAMNFDAGHSDEVRNFFIENALYWFDHYHLDGLRLDAIHAIFDMSAKPFLQELAERVSDFGTTRGKKYYLMPESNLNDTRLLRSKEQGGYGLDSQWSDDFHHSLHTLLTGETDGYYQDFGQLDDLAKAIREGFVYDWRFSPFRNRRHGNSSADRPAEQFIICTQNHDQIGNRMNGERLSRLISFEAQKLAAGMLLLSPNIPLLFMGEEYAEDNPFLYFVSHSDPDLIEAVRKGRKEEFDSFQWEGDPPDPQSEETFERSRLAWEKRDQGKHHTMWNFYQTLLNLRRSIPALSHLDKDTLDVKADNENHTLFLHRWYQSDEIFVVFNFQSESTKIQFSLPTGQWTKILDSASKTWDGKGDKTPNTVEGSSEILLSGHSLSLYRKETTI